MGKFVDLTAADGASISAWRAEPAGAPRGAVVIAQEIFGVNGHIRDVCEGYAADGYVAIAPALFDRYTPNVDLGYTPDDIAKGRELKARAGIEVGNAKSASVKSAIMIYLGGGPSHMDMYDLKPDAPMEFRGEFKPIPTNVAGVQICEHFPMQARM